MSVRLKSGVHKATERRVIQFVDDYVDNCLVYAEALFELDFIVEIAHDADDALVKARDTQPIAIVMDLWLPGVDGFEATRRLRADPRTEHIPVIALTGMPLARCAKQAYEAGCASVLAKPCAPERLAEEIDRLTGRGEREGSAVASAS
jgi:CheY-like chemotaxis protein